MENRKVTVLKVCHLVLIVVGVALCIYGCTFNGSTVYDKIALILKMAALVSSFVYLIKGYKKQADKCYKIFMWILGITEIIGYASLLNKGIQMPFFQGFISVLTFAAFMLIIAANDYGKVKSNIISIALVVLTGFTALSLIISFGILSLRTIISICQFIFALTTVIMVRAKYIDKDSRGAK